MSSEPSEMPTFWIETISAEVVSSAVPPRVNLFRVATCVGCGVLSRVRLSVGATQTVGLSLNHGARNGTSGDGVQSFCGVAGDPAYDTNFTEPLRVHRVTRHAR